VGAFTTRAASADATLFGHQRQSCRARATPRT
jgi:hypothetical protein